MWAGLLIGVLFALFTTGHAWLAVVAVGIGLGVLWGTIFGFAAHLATRGERDFSSLRALSAAHYDLIARGGGAERARTAPDQAGPRPPAARRPRAPGDSNPPGAPVTNPGQRGAPRERPARRQSRGVRPR